MLRTSKGVESSTVSAPGMRDAMSRAWAAVAAKMTARLPWQRAFTSSAGSSATPRSSTFAGAWTMGSTRKPPSMSSRTDGPVTSA